jgi:large subunit ribosomal protein L24e
MKIETCSFSGFKIYPGHGSLFVRGDSKVFRFVNTKNKSLFLQRKKAAKFNWTVVYRRLHKKDQLVDQQKKKKATKVKVQRAIVGLSLDLIKQKRDMPAAQRAQERKKAVEKVKEVKRVKREQKKDRVSKQQQKGAARKVQATSR